MYGLVNRAIQDMVIETHGLDSWHRIKAAAGVEVERFNQLTAYDDSVTYDLVAAASDELGTPQASVLEAFGVYWVTVTATRGYGDLLDMYGDNIPDFLEKLDEMHAHVELSYPELRPPSFRMERMSETLLRVQYVSGRRGLAPFVVGLLKGLGRRFETSVSVRHVVVRDDGAAHDIFEVQLPSEAA